ncbi:MAG: VCBS repeat-containing protein [Dyadobacter sp.]|uniref:VCBS repeat-containing protein n=1 Tax=Dyadobacter sp. TaxID=1914288 RepID=UPI0032646BF9
MKKIIILVSACIVYLTSCKSENNDKLFEMVAAKESGVTFVNQLFPTETNNILEYDYFFMGGGVAAADFDNDGYTDLYFSGNHVPGKLYRNQSHTNGENIRFQDVTADANLETKGWCSGVAAADVNGDGWQDLYICHAGLNKTANQLFINQGKQADGKIRFIDQAKSANVAFAGFSTQSAFLDYDKDGDLDLYLLTHYHEKVNPNYPRIKTLDGKSKSNDRLFSNDGKGRFTDVTDAAGINTEGFGLGIAVSDLNSDGWPDIYVSNDFAYDDNVFINNKNGTFTDQAGLLLRHTSRFSMGCDVADFNNDFFPDILTVDMMAPDNKRQKMMGIASSNELFNASLRNGYIPQYARNMLQLNNGDGSFSEIGQLAGIHKTDWSWSALFADLDNDGWKDIYITNGIPKDITNNDFTSFRDAEQQMGDVTYEQVRSRLLEQVNKLEEVRTPNFAFRNSGDGVTFIDNRELWGLDHRGFSNGAVYADLDNDGDLDLVTNNLNSTASIHRNKSNSLSHNKYLRIRFTDNRSMGAKVRIVTKHGEQFSENTPYRGFQSSQEQFVHFGLGDVAIVDTIEVIWPDGRFKRIISQTVNATLSLSYEPSQMTISDFSFGRKMSKGSSTLFENVNISSLKEYVHQENQYEDFNNEPLLPYRFSRNGPFMAVADIDKNGLDDFWIGGPAGTVGKLFCQQANGTFISKDLGDPGFEDQEGAFFDADGDKDMDLYVVSGGNEYNALTAAYQDRLYLNDGNGNFTRSKKAIPIEFSSGKCVKPADFDNDGDMDLFVGGRLIPNQYPRTPESFLFRNDGKGNFENVTELLAPGLGYIGMVTDATWSDRDKDGWMDLCIVGEFMPVTIFGNKKGHLKKSYETKEKGLWTSVDAGDFDEDGDPDLILGNWGINNNYNVSLEQPLSVSAVKFGDGVQPVLSYFNQGKEFTLAGRDHLVSRFPVIKKKFLTYHDFADAELQDLFAPQDIEFKLSANYLKSAWLKNNKKSYELIPLPLTCQFAPISDVCIGDFDLDGHLDILSIGNSFAPDFLSGRQDSFCGNVLLGDGKGRFNSMKSDKSGIMLRGDMKSICMLKIKGAPTWIVGANSEKLQMLTANKGKDN